MDKGKELSTKGGDEEDEVKSGKHKKYPKIAHAKENIKFLNDSEQEWFSLTQQDEILGEEFLNEQADKNQKSVPYAKREQDLKEEIAKNMDKNEK